MVQPQQQPKLLLVLPHQQGLPNWCLGRRLSGPFGPPGAHTEEDLSGSPEDSSQTLRRVGPLR